MNNKTIELLEYDKIKDILKGYGICEITKEKIDKLEPEMNIRIIENNLKETSEARAILNINSNVPIHSMKGIVDILEKLKMGGILLPSELEVIGDLLKEVKKLKRFMNGKEYAGPTISTYALSAFELSEVREEIERCIVYGRVDDRASTELSKIRKKIRLLEDKIKSKLEGVLKNEKYKNYIQEALVSQRNGRYVIPVKNEHRNNIEGEIHDRSNSNATVFIEPAEVKKAQDMLNYALIEEENEVYKILSILTNLVENNERQLNINIEVMLNYDFIFAKGKYSKAIDGRSPVFNNENYINIKKGRHPLLGRECVPLDLVIGKEYKAIVITGPNTGGKTVALKTLGLLTIMAQAGLHIPVEEGSEFSIFADVLVDIGDGQSIQQSLSTFSSHINNIINILNSADEHSLVIIDEIGAGTDPGEGMGIAIAVLEELYRSNSIILATTHYSEIKEFARQSEGFVNGCMEFDTNTLKPLYKLKIGMPGESNAFLIALRLGMNKGIIERAHRITYKEDKTYSDLKDSLLEKHFDNIEVTSNHEKQLEKYDEADKLNKLTEKFKEKPMFMLGDNVYISFMERTGVIYELENTKGEYGVMVMKKKLKINKKRLKLYIGSKELYPEDYDFDVIFESVENRKTNKLMNERHVEGAEIKH